jgi:hypothetical protein
MKNLRIRVCVLVLASWLCALVPSLIFAQDGGPIPTDPPDTQTSIGAEK